MTTTKQSITKLCPYIYIFNFIPQCPCNYLSMPGLNNVSKRACRCHTFISFACSLWQNFFLVNFLLEYQTEGSRFHKILLLRIHKVHLHLAICHPGPYHMIFDPGKVFEKSLFFILQNLWESLDHLLIGAECLFWNVLVPNYFSLCVLLASCQASRPRQRPQCTLAHTSPQLDYS